MLQTYRRRDLVSRGEWLATILGQLINDEKGAKEFLSAIADVWKEEDYWLPESVDGDRPDPGLLKAMGYRVGWHHGQPPETRALVIAFLLMSRHLPRIKDRQYMEEWGAPLSLKRYQKLDSVLRNLIEDKRRTRNPGMARAIEEWQDDLEAARFLWEDLKKS